jgi:hypothetical protein
VAPELDAKLGSAATLGEVLSHHHRYCLSLASCISVHEPCLNACLMEVQCISLLQRHQFLLLCCTAQHVAAAFSSLVWITTTCAAIRVACERALMPRLLLTIAGGYAAASQLTASWQRAASLVMACAMTIKVRRTPSRSVYHASITSDVHPISQPSSCMSLACPYSFQTSFNVFDKHIFGKMWGVIQVHEGSTHSRREAICCPIRKRPGKVVNEGSHLL